MPTFSCTQYTRYPGVTGRLAGSHTGQVWHNPSKIIIKINHQVRRRLLCRSISAVSSATPNSTLTGIMSLFPLPNVKKSKINRANENRTGEGPGKIWSQLSLAHENDLFPFARTHSAFLFREKLRGSLLLNPNYMFVKTGRR